MNLSYAPRKKLVEALEQGWRLLPDMEYDPGDFAILVFMPDYPIPMTAEQINRAVSKFEYTPPPPRLTHCKRGHFLSGDNLFIRSDGHRGCCACKRIRRRAEQAKRRLEVA